MIKRNSKGQFVKGSNSPLPFPKGHIPWMKGKHHTEASKEKMRKAKIGFIPWNKGKKRKLLTRW